jgi:hypothetical protein
MMTVVDMMTVPKKKAGEFLKLFCHDQVKILLERMDSNPEEFTSSERWDLFLPPREKRGTMPIYNLYKYFTKAEQFAIKTKINELVHDKMQQEAYNGIMDTLVKTDYKDMDDMFGKSSITYSNTTYSSAKVHIEEKAKIEYMLEKIKAMTK